MTEGKRFYFIFMPDTERTSLEKKVKQKEHIDESTLNGIFCGAIHYCIPIHTMILK